MQRRRGETENASVIVRQGVKYKKRRNGKQSQKRYMVSDSLYLANFNVEFKVKFSGKWAAAP